METTSDTRSPAAPEPGDRIRVTLTATFRTDARRSSGLLYVEHRDGTYALPGVIDLDIVERAQLPEPTGVGAVVEDADGGLWVRCDETDENLDRPWHGPKQAARQYVGITVARVLSQGVSV